MLSQQASLGRQTVEERGSALVRRAPIDWCAVSRECVRSDARVEYQSRFFKMGRVVSPWSLQQKPKFIATSPLTSLPPASARAVARASGLSQGVTVMSDREWHASGGVVMCYGQMSRVVMGWCVSLWVVTCGGRQDAGTWNPTRNPDFPTRGIVEKWRRFS